MEPIPILYCLKRNQLGVPKDKMYLCNEYRVRYGALTGNVDIPSLQWGPKEKATKYAEADADFLITFARALLSYTLEKEEWKSEE